MSQIQPNPPSYTQANITRNVDTSYAAQAYAQQAMQILSTPPQNINMQVITQMQQAYTFFQAMANQGTFTVPGTNQTLNFSTYGPTGILGSDGAKMMANIDSILQSYGKVTIGSPAGGTVTVMDATQNQPASLYDLIACPNDTFSFSFVDGKNDQMGPTWNPVSWSFGSGALQFQTVGNIPNSQTGAITMDANQNYIPGGGLTISLYLQEDNSELFEVTGNGAALVSYLSAVSQTSDSTAALQSLSSLVQKDL